MKSRKASVGISDADFERVKQRAARGACLLGLRFTADLAVPPERFRAGFWATPPTPWTDGEHPESLLLRKEIGAFLRGEIEKLPPNQRAVVLLRDVEGCTRAVNGGFEGLERRSLYFRLALEALEARSSDPEMSEEVLRLLRARHETRASQLPASLDPDGREVTAAGAGLTRELIGIERRCIHTLLRNGQITDETRRRIERDLDLEEASLANREFRKIPL